MKIIICDNCGGVGQEHTTGNLCEGCMVMWRIERDKVNVAIDVLESDLRKKFHIKRKEYK